MSRIANSLDRVRERIAEAAAKTGREAGSIELVAVSKGHPPESIRLAYDAGQRTFGENYAQELAAKADAMSGYPEVEWHFIGHVQSNKAKIVAAHAQLIHTVHSASLARELAGRIEKAGREVLPILIEVNVTGESQKHGVRPSDLSELIDTIANEPRLELRGLMTVPPAGDLTASREAFEKLGSLRSLHGGSSRLPELSMGMSRDLELAIACGATIVRVGTAIFGQRA